MTSDQVNITGEPGALPPGTPVAVSAAGTHAEFPDGFTATSAVIDVSVAAGLLQHPLTLEFPAPATTAGTPVVLHQTTSSSWALDPTQLDGTVLRISTDSFSNRVVGFLTSITQSAGHKFDGTTTPCTTTPAPPTWAVTTGPPASGVAHICLISNPDPAGVIRAELQIKSNRASFLQVTWNGTAQPDYVWVETEEGTVVKMVNAKMGLAANQVLLAPGKTMTLGFRQPVDNGTNLQIGFEQNNATTLLGVGQTAVGFLDDLVPVLGAIDACAQGNGSPSGLFDTAVVSMTPGDLLKCSFSVITSSLTAYANYLEARVRGPEGVLSADEAGALTKHVPALRAAAGLTKAVTGTLRAASAVAKSATYFQDAVNSFISGVNDVTMDLLPASAPPALAPDRTIGQPAPSTPACLDAQTAFGLAQDSGKVDGIVSASDISCIAPDVALGTLTDSIGEGLYSMWQLRNGTWTWVVATYGVNAVCEAVWRLYPAIDAGCGPQPTVDGLTIAKCVSLNMMYVGMKGDRDQVALLQTTLKNMGFDPGNIDGFFGANTFVAAAQSQDAFADGTSGGNGVFADEQSILAIVFQHLGIAC